MTQIILGDLSTWPASLLAVLEKHHDVFADWERPIKSEDRFAVADHAASVQRARKFDAAIHDVGHELLQHSFLGYHCTRLADVEIRDILSGGMPLRNAEQLHKRILDLVENQQISAEIAQMLLARNQSGDRNRENMIWFCLFQPNLVDQGAVERFFRSWGGEALYNSHERDPVTGPILRSIGSACLIEADVPGIGISSISGLAITVARDFSFSCGLRSEEPTENSIYIITDLPASAIQRLIRFNEPEFSRLTGCDTWSPPLS